MLSFLESFYWWLLQPCAKYEEVQPTGFLQLACCLKEKGVTCICQDTSHLPSPISLNLSPPASSVVTRSTPVGMRVHSHLSKLWVLPARLRISCALAASPASAQQAAGWHQDLLSVPCAGRCPQGPALWPAEGSAAGAAVPFQELAERCSTCLVQSPEHSVSSPPLLWSCHRLDLISAISSSPSHSPKFCVF